MRRACRVESLDQQVQQYRTVLADRIHHHRILEPGDNLAEDVDAFRLEAVEVAWGGRAHLLHSALNVGPAAHCTCAFRPRRNVQCDMPPRNQPSRRLARRAENPPPSSRQLPAARTHAAPFWAAARPTVELPA